MECNVNSKHTVDRFRKAYVITAFVPWAICFISFLCGIISKGIDFIPASIVFCAAVVPFIPMFGKGGMAAHLSFAIWISRVYAVVFSILQVYSFVGLFVSICAPYVYITSMVLFAVFYLCPWVITALRSLQLEHPSKLAEPATTGNPPLPPDSNPK